MPGTEVEFEVDEEDAGDRLDVFLARRSSGLSRARAKRMIEEGSVLVDGRRLRKSYVVSPGDRITLERLAPRVDFHARPDPDVPIEIVRETDDYVLVEKPAGTPSHPLEEDELGTLAGALVARYPEMRGLGYSNREPGLLHRLDTHTSGLMLAARNREAFDALRRQLRSGEIEKRYLARCQGVVDGPIVIDTAIANDPRDRRKVRACTNPREVKRLRAQASRTEVLSSVPAAMGSLLELRANNARRHQIRVHLASIGHPLLGDTLYGGPPLEKPAHHLLHASAIKLGTEPMVTSLWKYASSDPVAAS
jgi:23S rRNA pseudouridine1911/1915/1917 synthase